MYLDRYWSVSEIILSTDCYCGRCFYQSIIRSTKSRSIFRQSIEFEATYLQHLQKRVIRSSLPSDLLRTLLQAFVTCRLDYCNSLLVGLPPCDTIRLQSVPNAAGRLFGGVPRFESVDHVLRDDLHWLPVKQRIMASCLLT